ncbi:MAG: TlpA family protein disulfide reductase [Acidobacteria bacterium]|nr:TlpA family protein disulfide reductase [Acidobacteriota bacterium]
MQLTAQQTSVVRDVRLALGKSDFAAAQQALDTAKKEGGVTPRWLEAHSWMGRGYLAAKKLNEADKSAAETRAMALTMLKGRKLDDDKALPTALGASIEVQAQVLEARGQRSEAVAFLQEEVKRWQGTSIVARLQKNLHLISLVGKPAPALAMKEYLGQAPPSLASLKGKKVLLFFWAHWCGDCKAMAPTVARLKQEFPQLVVIGPTQPYGYVARGEEATRDVEIRYIDEIRKKFYSAIDGLLVPVSEENFRQWGASTTPTVAVIDAAGIVRLYHPGQMSYEELLPALK